MFCTKFGIQLEDGVAFCRNCGNPVAQQTAQNENGEYAEFEGTIKAENIIDDDVCALIGEEKQEYYLNRFAQMKQGNKKATWNWCAFLFTPAWFIYRKMYAYGAIVFVISYLLDEMLPNMDLLFSVLCGVFANYIYMTHLEKLALQAKAMTEPAKSQFIEKNKSTSWAAVGFAALAMFAITFVGAMLFSFAA